MNGKIILFTGEGKGKTSAAIGMAIRAAGHGYKIVFIQFLKKGLFGETKTPIKNVTVKQFGREQFVIKPEKKDFELARKGLTYALESLKSKPFMVILDEIHYALSIGLLSIEDIIQFLDKREEVHVVLTGRNAPQMLIDMADIVTDMKNIKHYYTTNDRPSIGLEF